MNCILVQTVILVEGNSKYILIPQLTINTFNYTLKNHGVEPLSGDNPLRNIFRF
ncbi:TOPRIM nucleotidyl transferase/hydrolase domain-containing protein [Paenibacillus phytohabitans]|uniref:TOPRIM nucleotidyl transferase/hydrolase domain-containing protein n=1 Tax=Paenibacillus phytohabitans TaxID=2654978 RepID=UPI003AB36F97